MDNRTAREAVQVTVSRETFSRLEIYVALVERWQKLINLVAPSTLNQIWSRHIFDSLQLLYLAPQAQRWIDIGSGGGFPGLVISAALAEITDGRILLIESDKRKCAFLREAAREMRAPVDVICGRIEQEIPQLTSSYDIVSARALASLPVLLDYTMPLLEKGTIGLFLKGKDVERELTQIPQNGTVQHKIFSSQSDPEGSIVKVWL